MNENNPKIIGNIIIALILSASIIVSVFIGVYGLADYKAKRNTINVKGLAEQQITSDLIVWTGYFHVQAADIKEGYSLLEADKEKVKNYLVGKGLKEEDLIFSAISTSENYAINEFGQYTNVISDYTLSQNVTVNSAEVDKVTEISRTSTELISEGVQFDSYAPEYHYTKLADLKVTMLADATADARKRAEMIAENSDSKLGGLTHANVSGIQITPLYANTFDYYDYGYYMDRDIKSLEKEVTVTVYCVFEIE